MQARTDSAAIEVESRVVCCGRIALESAVREAYGSLACIAVQQQAQSTIQTHATVKRNSCHHFSRLLETQANITFKSCMTAYTIVQPGPVANGC